VDANNHHTWRCSLQNVTATRRPFRNTMQYNVWHWHAHLKSLLSFLKAGMWAKTNSFTESHIKTWNSISESLCDHTKIVFGKKKWLWECSRNNQHNALICIAPLFYILAPTCLGSSLPTSGSFLDPSELLEIQIRQVVYHIMCGYVACVLECCGFVCCASQLYFM
jgi:hypothetical protein